MLGEMLKILFGLILIIGAVFVFVTFNGWQQAVIDFLQGGILILIALLGLIFLLLGFSELRE